MASFMLRCLTWTTLCKRTQNHPKIFGTCASPGLPLQLIVILISGCIKLF